MDMKINKSAIAIILATTLCFTSVAPALAAETSGEDSVVTAVSEELDNEGLTEGEEKDNSGSGDSENIGNEQSLDNLGDNTSDHSNGDSDAANETSTEEISENEAIEENIDGISEEIGETAAKATIAEETAAVEEPSEIDISNEAKAAATFAGGSGTQRDPYKVSNAAQLDAVRYYPEKYFIQTADINLSGVNWKPILDEEPDSWGGYNGNGYSISNLTITNCTSMYIGVFGFAGYIENVTVKNTRIEVTKNNANEELNIGLIAGCAQLDNCSAQGSISVNIKDSSQCSIGGLVGSSPAVEGSHSDVSINVTHNGSGFCRIGGIAGTSLYGVANKSYNKGNITSSGRGRVRIGGILGEAFLYTSISKCVNYGTVESKGTNSNNTIAGIIAWMSSNGDPYVEYSVNFGNIKDTENGVAYAAGIGRNGQTDEFSINNCFDLGDINGNLYSGRIYPSETNSSNSNSNYSYGQSLVNNQIPNGGLLPSGFNGMNMSAEDIRTEISDILNECGCEWVEPKTRIIFTPTVILSTSTFVYNGNTRRPNVTVKKGNTTLSPSDYSVTYASGRKYPGVYKVTVKLKGNYFGSKTVSFKIIPKPTTVSKLVPGSKKVTVKWTKPSKMLTGYQIQYAADAKFTKNKRTVTVKSPSTLSKTITGLAGGKKCYVRIRTYKRISGKTYYSTWSKMKSITVRK